LLVLTIALILLGISLSVVVPRATNAVKQGKEKELRFILREFRNAIIKYRFRNNHEPYSIEDLLSDEKNRPFLRRIYSDPFTGKPDWEFIQSATETTIISRSKEISLSGVPYCDFR